MIRPESGHRSVSLGQVGLLKSGNDRLINQIRSITSSQAGQVRYIWFSQIGQFRLDRSGLVILRHVRCDQVDQVRVRSS